MISINIDLSALDSLRDLEGVLKAEAAAATRNLAAMGHAKALELAGQRLHTRRQMFVDSLSLQEDDGVMVLELAAKAVWIDNGLQPFNMLDSLLSSPKAKTSKDGSRYLVVPFDHSPGHGATNTTPTSLDLVNTVKSEMKQRGIPWAKIERDDQGRPKLGKLHQFSVTGAPLKTGNGPGQGWGPVGAVRQGPSEQQLGTGGGGHGTPFLQGVNIYQKQQSGGGVKRSVMTFRIASSKHEGQGRWEHPGTEAAHIFDDVEKWAYEQIDNLIVPDLMERIIGRL